MDQQSDFASLFSEDDHLRRREPVNRHDEVQTKAKAFKKKVRKIMLHILFGGQLYQGFLKTFFQHLRSLSSHTL